MVLENQCVLAKAFDFLGKKWSFNVLLELYKGGNCLRYSALKKSLRGITPKMLSLRLRELEIEGLVKKNSCLLNNQKRCSYRLTSAGEDFIRIIKQIKKWSLRWKFENKRCEGYDCSQCKLKSASK